MRPTTSADVFQLLDCYVASAAVGTAMEAGLFWLLLDQPLDVPGVSRTLDIPPDRCRHWLQLLTGLGLLERDSGKYAPSAVARAAILDSHSQGTWAFLAREARERGPAVVNLAEHIHTPGSVWELQGLTPPDYLANMMASPERARSFTRMLSEIHQPLAGVLAGRVDMTGVERILDLGGGSGVMSMALLRRSPDAIAVVLDIANVCAAGREIAREEAMEDRITYEVCNFVENELPSPADLILQCDVGPYREPLFRRIHAALNPGGRLVILDQLAAEEGMAHPARVHWALLGALEKEGARWPTAAGIRTQLTPAGFRIESEEMLLPGDAGYWSRDWTLIIARKD